MLKQIQKSLIVISFIFVYLLSNPCLAIAAPVVDFTKQTAIAVEVSLSNQNNELKLMLNNVSNLKHYFTSKDFADAIWTQNVVAGNVEIKGNIRELELRPNTAAAWTFIPIKSGTYELHCEIAGHTEAGMRGTITIQPSV